MSNAKLELYSFVDSLRDGFGFNHYVTINARSVIEWRGGHVIERKYSTTGIGAFSVPGRIFDTVVLNSAKDKIEQNFDCCHELIHLTKHRHLRQNDVNWAFTHSQNTFLEWEANEGAAECLVPYRDFIPRFSRLYQQVCSGVPLNVQNLLSQYYQVSERVISLRMNHLAYEIDCFRSGTPIENIHLLSKSERHRRKIAVTNYEARCAFPLSWDAVIG